MSQSPLHNLTVITAAKMQVILFLWQQAWNTWPAEFKCLISEQVPSDHLRGISFFPLSLNNALSLWVLASFLLDSAIAFYCDRTPGFRLSPFNRSTRRQIHSYVLIIAFCRSPGQCYFEHCLTGIRQSETYRGKWPLIFNVLDKHMTK